MMTMNELLIEWNLPDLIPAFEENEVTPSILPDLTEKMLEELIPKIGQRAMVKKNIMVYLEKNSEVVNVPSQIFIVENSTPTTDAYGGKTEVLNWTDIPATSSTSWSDIISWPAEKSTPASSVASFTSSTPVPPVSEPEPPTQELSNTPTPPCLSSLKKRKLTSFASFDLLALLKESCTGRALLSIYNSEKKLESKYQGYLVDIIVDHILNTDCSPLTNDDLKDIAEKITEIFPNEVREVYYTSPIRKQDSRNNKSGMSRGKLRDKYKNKLTFLRRGNQVSTYRTQHSDTEITNTENHESNNVDKTWLVNNFEPWAEVCVRWQNCFPLRHSEINQYKNVTDFFNEWPVLKTSLGYTLIDADFSRLFPDKEELLFNNFETTFKYVLKLKRNNLQANDVMLLDILNSTNLPVKDDTKYLLILTLLAALVPLKAQTTINTKKGKSWKPSVIESREGIIKHALLPGDIEKIIEDKRAKMQKKHETVQPFIIVEGPNTTDIKKAYVSIDNTLYCVPSVLKAIDICFKSFHVLQAHYPKESTHLWLLIQYSVFNIKTKYDNKIPNIIDLVQKIDLLKKTDQN